jgi:hypothetical protein
MNALYDIDDPVSIALENPYTFFLPSADLIDAVRAGDHIKAVVRANPPSEKYDAERMWVRVSAITLEAFEGALDSDPHDMPLLKHGMPMRVPKTAVIEVDLAEHNRLPPNLVEHREYWDRCLVDSLVLDRQSKVGYLYREQPDMAQDTDKFPDSGWRIRADFRGCTDDEIAQRKLQYVAIGLVLNADDCWLHLIDAPIGACFDKDFERDVFVPSK